MDVGGLIQFYAPELAADTDAIAQALALSADKRPACLSDEKQDEAQAYFALHLLFTRSETQSRIYKSEREGDLQREYFTADEQRSNSAFWLSKYNGLNRLCGASFGSITVGNYGKCQGNR